MAVSKVQPMREAEQELIDTVNGQIGQISALEQGLEDANTVVGQLSQEIGAEIERAKAAEQANASAIEVLQTDVATIPVFDFGETEGTEIETGTATVIAVEFAEAKENIPHVFITLEDIETNEHTADCAGVIVAVDTSGFGVRVLNDSADTATIKVIWMAIGE